ncbi:MAG: hypothetical protein F4Y03_04525 [Alphaproteobacteria bacterium]|nr:hypothetical protein [Alphaproteobacteria bacterium]
MDGNVISIEMLTILLAAIGLAGLILTTQSRMENRLTKQSRDLEERLTKQNRDLEERLTQQIQESDKRLLGRIGGLEERIGGLEEKIDDLRERVARVEGKFEIFEKFLRWNSPPAAQEEGD